MKTILTSLTLAAVCLGASAPAYATPTQKILFIRNLSTTEMLSKGAISSIVLEETGGAAAAVIIHTATKNQCQIDGDKSALLALMKVLLDPAVGAVTCVLPAQTYSKEAKAVSTKHYVVEAVP